VYFTELKKINDGSLKYHIGFLPNGTDLDGINEENL